MNSVLNKCMVVVDEPPPLEDMTKVLEKMHLDTGQHSNGIYNINREKSLIIIYLIYIYKNILHLKKIISYIQNILNFAL